MRQTYGIAYSALSELQKYAKIEELGGLLSEMDINLYDGTSMDPAAQDDWEHVCLAMPTASVMELIIVYLNDYASRYPLGEIPCDFRDLIRNIASPGSREHLIIENAIHRSESNKEHHN